MTEQEAYQLYLEAAEFTEDDFSFEQFLARQEAWQPVAPLVMLNSDEEE